MQDITEQLAVWVDKMPAFSASVTRVLELTSDVNVSAKELVQVINHDPVMTVKILKLVNSAYFGLSRQVTDINQGVVYVGFNTIKNIALTIAAIGVLPSSSKGGLDMEQFLLHSIGTATIAHLLSDRLRVDSREATDYFVGGLLHDFGKTILARHMSEQFQQALLEAEATQQSLYTMENDALSIDHAALGGMLGEHWQLPQSLVDCMRLHHGGDDLGESSSLLDSVIAANQMIRQLKFGASGNPIVEELPEQVQQRFGMDLQELIESLGDLEPELEKARIFSTL